MGYKEKLKLAKEALDSGSYDKDTIEYIFPELKESEDEKLRKCTISLLKIARDKGFYDIPKAVNNCITWLEKQGEKKPILDVEIPFGAKDSDLEEVTYDIPKGYHAEIEDNKVVIKKGEQKPAEWSEEDEKMLEYALDMIEWYSGKNENKSRLVSDWLKSHRPQSTWKPSDEQMEALEHFIVYHNGSTNYAKDLEELRLQLKKLKG